MPTLVDGLSVSQTAVIRNGFNNNLNLFIVILFHLSLVHRYSLSSDYIDAEL